MLISQVTGCVSSPIVKKVPVHCAGSWSDWTPCAQNRRQIRTYTVTRQPSNGGITCPSSPEIQSCVPEEEEFGSAEFSGDTSRGVGELSTEEKKKNLAHLLAKGGGECVNHNARITMMNGSKKLASEIKVGDILASVNGKKGNKVIARMVSKKYSTKVIKVKENLLLTEKHPIYLNERGWKKPVEVENAVEINNYKGDLYNFLLKGRKPFIAENEIVS